MRDLLDDVEVLLNGPFFVTIRGGNMDCLLRSAKQVWVYRSGRIRVCFEDNGDLDEYILGLNEGLEIKRPKN